LGLEHTRLTDSIHTQGWGVRSTLRTSANDMVRLLVRMAQDKLVDAWSSKQMIAIMEAQEINTLLPEPLPDVPIAHKTGSFNDTLNDVGIVYAGSSPYVIAVMTTNLRSLSSGRSFIRRVSKLAYRSLNNFAKWREANGMDQPVEAPAQADTTQPQEDSAQQDVPMWGTPTPSPSASP
ncbi:MAG: serine hydrolase, partial [Candidatus Eremiobacteraeota bacterium]|nr:serine hydrolase [Candidatus Eremiobacteraeota bacterium]